MRDEGAGGEIHGQSWASESSPASLVQATSDRFLCV